jgi:copper homeostasis protein
MIRPRIGDFCFSESDMEVMLQDILEFKNASVYGVVIGVLTPESKVDVERTRRWVVGMSPGFH